jgi:hypothetical protein
LLLVHKDPANKLIITQLTKLMTVSQGNAVRMRLQELDDGFLMLEAGAEFGALLQRTPPPQTL